jgi:hypothetical protein
MCPWDALSLSSHRYHISNENNSPNINPIYPIKVTFFFAEAAQKLPILSIPKYAERHCETPNPVTHKRVDRVSQSTDNKLSLGAKDARIRRGGRAVEVGRRL